MTIPLSAFQSIQIRQVGEGIDATVEVFLTSAMDEEFVNRSVRAVLNEDDQRKIIKAFRDNLQGKELD